jgi:TIR domain/FHA domain
VSTVIHFVAAGETYTFSDRQELLLGRADTADVRFTNPFVSRRHGKLTHTADGWVYEDVGSTRGTRFRGRPVHRLSLVGPVTLLLGEPGKGEEVHITPEIPSQIFICYRRTDAAGHAGRMRDRLIGAFGESQVFLDTEQVGIGEDFVARTTSVVASCRVLLVVIGPRWLDVRDAQGRRRLDVPDDYVRLEIATALRAVPPVTVVPVLVQGATMPREEDLPPDLHALSRINALSVPDERWHSEIDRLVTRLESLIGVPRVAAGGTDEPAPEAGTSAEAPGL